MYYNYSVKLPGIEWSNGKASENLLKHKISFEVAIYNGNYEEGYEDWYRDT
jgi:hypothetical protein